MHTVAHELGHALGLDHVLEEDAVMHPTTSENLELTDIDVEVLNNFCIEQNKFEFIKGNLEILLRNVIGELKANINLPLN